MEVVGRKSSLLQMLAATDLSVHVMRPFKLKLFQMPYTSKHNSDLLLHIIYLFIIYYLFSIYHIQHGT